MEFRGCHSGRRSALALAAACVFVVSCYPAAISDVAELDVVAALHGDTTKFDAVHTFAMPDTIVHITQGLGAGEVGLTRQFDALILSTVAQNLEQLGYVRVTDPVATRPDVIVLVGATASVQVEAWVSYPWFGFWGFYPGFAFNPAFNPAWGIAYPWAGSVSAFTWNQGTLIVDMIDTHNIDTQNLRVSSLWAGALSGVLGVSSSVPPQTRLTQGIDEMFVLSPYLRKN